MKKEITGLLLFSMLFSSCQHPETKISHPTFSENIAPIIYKNCTLCHRPGSAGPFNLISYNDVKKHAKTIALTVESRLMPPWTADPAYSHSRDEKILPDKEIELIKKWVEDDSPE